MPLLSPKGRTLPAKSPLWVRKGQWPDPQILMNKPPPRWRRTTLQATFSAKCYQAGTVSDSIAELKHAGNFHFDCFTNAISRSSNVGCE